VKGGGKDYPAGQVALIYFNAAEGNEAFKDGDVRGSSRFWQEAAESYGQAAEELKGSARQAALYKQLLTLANLGDVDATLTAAEQFLTEYPKSFYFGPVQIKRALVYASKGRQDEAVAALKRVADAPGMNPRDLFEAEYLRIWLTKMVPARTKEQFADAEKEFRGLVEAIDKNPRGKADASDQRVKAQARIAKTMLLQGKGTEARTLMDQTLTGLPKATERPALAAAYGSRGDALNLLAKQAMEGGKRADAKTLAEQAVLDYLRVAIFYGDEADPSDLFNATQNAARVFRSLFNLSGDKDCELARWSYDCYVQAAGMLGAGEEKRTLVREGLSLKEAMDKACGSGETPPPK
jgi:tetratricopeptide (TPR) repeat protein